MKRGGPLKRRTPLKRSEPLRAPPSAFMVLWKRGFQQCIACGSTRGLQPHHRVPQSDGGEDSDTNVRALCWQCHADFMQICGIPTQIAIQGNREAHLANAKKWLEKHPHTRTCPSLEALHPDVYEMIADEPWRQTRELEARRQEMEGSQ